LLIRPVPANSTVNVSPQRRGDAKKAGRFNQLSELILSSQNFLCASAVKKIVRTIVYKPMKKYFLIGGPVTFAVIFNLGYVFHEIIMGDFFKLHIGAIQRESYIIPLIALAFVLYTAFQAYFLPVYFEYTSRNYNWGLF